MKGMGELAQCVDQCIGSHREMVCLWGSMKLFPPDEGETGDLSWDSRRSDYEVEEVDSKTLAVCQFPAPLNAS